MVIMKWIILEEYAKKYKTSLSLLKSKIRLGQVEYILTGGRYKLKDLPLYENSSLSSAPLPKNMMLEDLNSKIKDLTALVNKKTKEMNQLKANYEDLKNLSQFLEKENHELKDLLANVKKMEAFLKAKEPPAPL